MSYRKHVRTVLLVLAIGLVALAIRYKLIRETAREHLAAGRAALLNDDPTEALRLFELCLAVDPENAEANYLAARAARRCGDFNAAKTHLKKAESSGRAPGEIEVERALIHAQTGYRAEAEPVLAKHVREGGADTAEIAELLVPVFLTEYRILEADALTSRWVELRPDSAKAWAVRADVLERRVRKDDAILAWRRVVALTPEDRGARLSLARRLLEAQRPPDEAAVHLEWLIAFEPENVSALIQLAACREAQGRPDDAAAILDRVIAGPARDAKALHLRGRLELNRGRAPAALGFLRRSLELDPSGLESLYTHFLAVQQTGTPDEIREAEARWKRCDTDLRRVGTLARMVDASPKEPDLRREMGELYLRNGRTAEGLRWLESALRLDPHHAPTHRVLAVHYERSGNAELARHHFELAKGP